MNRPGHSQQLFSSQRFATFVRDRAGTPFQVLPARLEAGTPDDDVGTVLMHGWNAGFAAHGVEVMHLHDCANGDAAQ